MINQLTTHRLFYVQKIKEYKTKGFQQNLNQFVLNDNKGPQLLKSHVEKRILNENTNKALALTDSNKRGEDLMSVDDSTDVT